MFAHERAAAGGHKVPAKSRLSPCGTRVGLFLGSERLGCHAQDLAGHGASIQTEGATVELHSLELQGYGPYRSATLLRCPCVNLPRSREGHS